MAQLRLTWAEWQPSSVVGLYGIFTACVSTAGVPHWNERGGWVFWASTIVIMKTASNRTLTHTLIECNLSCNGSLNEERESWATSWSAGVIQQILGKRKETKSKNLVYLHVFVWVFACGLFEWKPPQRNPVAPVLKNDEIGSIWDSDGDLPLMWHPHGMEGGKLCVCTRILCVWVGVCLCWEVQGAPCWVNNRSATPLPGDWCGRRRFYLIRGPDSKTGAMLLSLLFLSWLWDMQHPGANTGGQCTAVE